MNTSAVGERKGQLGCPERSYLQEFFTASLDYAECFSRTITWDCILSAVLPLGSLGDYSKEDNAKRVQISLNQDVIMVRR